MWSRIFGRASRSHRKCQRESSPALEPLESRLALSASATLPTVNLINAAGFESGLGSWTSTAAVGLATTTSQSHTGAFSARMTNRAQDWYGPRQTLQGPFTDGEQIAVALWVKVENAAEAPFNILIRQSDSSGIQFHYIVQDTATNTEWRELRGTFNLDITGTLTSLEIWVAGPPAGVNFLVDDVTVGRFPWEAAANARIDQLHKSDASVQIVDQFGNALQGATIEIRQTTKDFAFGSAINSNVLTNTAYANFARQAFNWATIEYESTWGSNEFTRGTESYYSADQIIAWTQSNDIQLRGHHLLWSEGGVSWLDSVPDSELLAEIDQRLTNALAHYSGDILQWDVLNESLNGDYFVDRLGDWITPWIYQRAKQLAPNVELFVNEYQIFEGFLADDYVDHIGWIQSQGGTVDGIGVQAHLPGVVEPFTVLSRFDELSVLGLPIWITEFDVASPDANVRADQLEMFYRLAYSHPDVKGIYLWDFWAGSVGRDPNRALMDADGTINAAGLRLLTLMEEWTTTVATQSVTSTPLTFRGFHGDYEVVVTLADGTQSIQNIHLGADDPTASFTLTIPIYPKVAFAGVPADDVGVGSIYSVQLAATQYPGGPVGGAFTYEFDWNRDNVYEQTVVGSSSLAITHTYYTLGAQSFQLRVRDSRGAVSAPIQQMVAVTGFQLLNDAVNPSLKNLTWAGTFGADTVVFTELGPNTIRADILQLDGDTENLSYTFAGVTGQVVASGLASDDVLDASALSTTSVELRGGMGNDSLYGSAAEDRLFGEDGDDLILGDGLGDSVRGAADWIDGGAGHDTIEADGPEGSRSAPDTVYGGDGNDTILSDGGEGSADNIFAGAGDDFVYAGGGSDYADGGAGNDILLGGDGGEGAADTLMGVDGRDILIGDGGGTQDSFIAGADQLSGGTGEDIILSGLYLSPNTDALLAIRDEWTSSRYYYERIANIFGTGSGPRNNGNYFFELGVNTFNDRTGVFSPSVVDNLFGGGDLDWFLIDLAGDVGTDRIGSEVAHELLGVPLPA